MTERTNEAAVRLPNACGGCNDCFHPAFGPNTDGDPCPYCQDCGCHKDEHPSAHPNPEPPTGDGGREGVGRRG